MDPWDETIVPDNETQITKEDTVDPVTAALNALIDTRIDEHGPGNGLDEDTVNDLIETYFDSNIESSIERWVDSNLDVSDAVRDVISYSNLSSWEDEDPSDFVRTDDIDSAVSTAVEDAIGDLRSEIEEVQKAVDPDVITRLEARLDAIEDAIRNFGGSI